MNSMPLNFYQKNKVGFVCFFSSGKNDRQPSEAVPATPLSFSVRKTHEPTRKRVWPHEEALWCTLSEEDMANEWTYCLLGIHVPEEMRNCSRLIKPVTTTYF